MFTLLLSLAVAGPFGSFFDVLLLPFVVVLPSVFFANSLVLSFVFAGLVPVFFGEAFAFSFVDFSADLLVVDGSPAALDVS